MITTSIVFDHRGRTAKGSEGPIEVRVTINRKPYYISTGIRVDRRRLKAGVIIDTDKTRDADELNKRLGIIYKRISEEVNECLDVRRPLDVADIRRKVWNCINGTEEEKHRQTINEWIKEQVPLMGLSAGRAKHYETLRGRLDGFGQMRYWEDVTIEMLYKWDAWLHTLKKPLTANQMRAGLASEAIGQSTVFTYHKNLKAVLNRAMLLGVITSNPYNRIRGVFKRGECETVKYLTIEQMKAVQTLELRLGSQLAMARDIFLFQMYTGLAYSDAQAFDINAYKDVGGKWVYVGRRIKTGVPYVSMLLPQAVAVLERNGWQVPTMNNQRYNVLLKKIGKKISIDGLHSHMARHTFATFMLGNGAKIENVSKMLGHTNIKQTQRYAKVLAESVLDDFEMVEKKLSLRESRKA